MAPYTDKDVALHGLPFACKPQSGNIEVVYPQTGRRDTDGKAPKETLRALLLVCTMLAPNDSLPAEPTATAAAPDRDRLEVEYIEPVDVGMDSLEEDALPSWIDRQHALATNRAQALAQWTDAFFGAQVQDAERADTFMRVIVADQWDQKDGHDFRFRLRGQINLPAISRRLDLVFSGAAAEDDAAVNEPSRAEQAGLRLNVTSKKRARFDATLSASSGPALVPGVRFRFQDAITENSWYRFRQRYMYNTDRGHILISDLGLNGYIAEGSLLRWSGRMRYRDDRETWDWSQRFTYRRWFDDHKRYPGAVELYASWGGNDDPELRTADFRVGALFRRQWLRPFLYYEIEPNYALRQDEIGESRKWYPGITLRLEIMLDDDLIQ